MDTISQQNSSESSKVAPIFYSTKQKQNSFKFITSTWWMHVPCEHKIVS